MRPTPSTCPCTMCPPRRASARSASSRFTLPPGSSAPSVERCSVSCMACAANSPDATPLRAPSRARARAAGSSTTTSTAVRQTPSTAIESPSLNSPASAVAIRSVAPSASRSTAAMRPRSAISPVNKLPPPRSSATVPAARAHTRTRARGGVHQQQPSPLAQPRGDEQILADARAVEGERAQGLRDALDAFALERVAGGAPAEQQRREEQADLVDLAGVEEGTGEMGTALEQNR